jgi:hypothetical protein
MNTLSELAGNAKGKRDYLSVVEKEIGELMNECHAGLRDLKSREWDRILFWLRSTKETVIHSKPLSVYIQQKPSKRTRPIGSDSLTRSFI